MELLHVPMDWQIDDIFTKPLGLDKLRQFSSALGVKCLHMPKVRGRNEKEAESDTEFDFGSIEEVGVHVSTEEAEAVCRVSHRNRKHELEPTKKGEGKAKKIETQTWADVVKGLKIKDKLETTNSDKSGNKSETADPIEISIWRNRINQRPSES